MLSHYLLELCTQLSSPSSLVLTFTPFLLDNRRVNHNERRFVPASIVKNGGERVHLDRPTPSQTLPTRNFRDGSWEGKFNKSLFVGGFVVSAEGLEPSTP